MPPRATRIHGIAADVTDEHAVSALYEKARSGARTVRHRRGECRRGGQRAGAQDDARPIGSKTLDVNLTGAFLTVKPALAGMAARKAGRIVFVASVAGLKGYAYVAPYVAAKHGVIGLMRALAAETAKSGVTVNAVCPGYVETDMLDHAVSTIVEKTGRSVEEARAFLTATNPQGRLDPAGRSGGNRALALQRESRLDHRPGDLDLGRRDMVSAPLSAISKDSKERLRLWIRMLRASRTHRGGAARTAAGRNSTPRCRAST